jgi:hypothetical protein
LKIALLGSLTKVTAALAVGRLAGPIEPSIIVRQYPGGNRAGPNLEALVKELQNYSCLRGHPNIQWILGYDRPRMCVVLRDYPLGSLNTFLRSFEVNVSAALALAVDVARGLMAFHAMDLVHLEFTMDHIYVMDVAEDEQERQQPQEDQFLRAVIGNLPATKKLSDGHWTAASPRCQSSTDPTPELCDGEHLARLSGADYQRLNVYQFALVLHALISSSSMNDDEWG